MTLCLRCYTTSGNDIIIDDVNSAQVHVGRSFRKYYSQVAHAEPQVCLLPSSALEKKKYKKIIKNKIVIQVYDREPVRSSFHSIRVQAKFTVSYPVVSIANLNRYFMDVNHISHLSLYLSIKMM